jgi:thiol-disulfide isomerase/thioredoxin
LHLKALSFSAEAGAWAYGATKLFGAESERNGIRVDQGANSTHYRFTVKYRSAPEVRGTLFSRQIATPVSAAAIALVAALSLGLRAQAAELMPWTKGPQPLFTLPSLDGADVALGSQRGSVVLVHFFATWCEPCREELPALTRLSERGGSSVKILAISVAEVDARVQRFRQSISIKFPVLLDRESAVTKSWEVSTLPTTFVLDSQLNPRLVIETDYAWDTVDPKKLIDTMSAAAGRDEPQ